MILNDIAEKKKKYLIKHDYKPNMKKLYTIIESKSRPSFHDALGKKGLSIIGEIKKASPSRGIIKENFEPVKLAAEYGRAVDAVSVLTETDYFQGRPEYIAAVKSIVDIPILCKDFIISPLQILEACENGASAALLITALLKESFLINDYIRLLHSLGMDALTEVHDERELDTALAAGADIIGINNRNLIDFSENLGVTEKLSALVPEGILVVAESSVHGAEDIKRLADCNVDAVLIGEHFMQCSDIPEEARLLRAAWQ